MRQIVEDQFATDVRATLTADPRQLPSRYFYDELGSALFEAICRLPWYPITRAEGRLLGRHRSDVFRSVTPSHVVELGSGSGEKLKLLLEAPEARERAMEVHLVDLSAAALDQAERTLAGFDNLRVIPHEASYEDGLRATARVLDAEDCALTLFLGSNLGNFDPGARRTLLSVIRQTLRPGDVFALGTDLVKPRAAMEIAYADPVGVTAAFNRNLLARVNRELGGNFDLDAFAHRAIWNDAESRVEMHLLATRSQRVRVAAADLEFTIAAGETIWTESSYKFRPEGICEMLAAAGFRVQDQWVDPVDPFALTVAEAV
jgi:L-histidine Nalpha-methyltransferase